MFERLVLAVSDSDNYTDLAVLSMFFGLLSVILVHRVVPFRVGSQELAGVMAVLILSLAMAYPFVRYLLERERAEVQTRWNESRLLKRHAEDLSLYLAFFIGTTFAFAIATFVVPESFFSVQLEVLQSIGAPTGSITNPSFFMEIVENNLWVFAVTFVLTFFVTSGIVFVLAWNASVLGVLVGTLSQSVLHVPLLTLPYLPHGILEIGGYILAGIAGALMSYQAEEFMMHSDEAFTTAKRVGLDAVTLLAIGVGLILVAGAVEVI